MLTRPCKTTVDHDPQYPLIWDDIKEREGIYQTKEQPDVRVIVISRYDGQMWGCLAFWPNEQRLHIVPNGWSHTQHYRRLADARLCFEVQD